MNNRSSGLALIFLVLVLPVGLVFGQTRTVGVAVGDSYRYSCSFDIDMGNLTEFAFPAEFDVLFDQVRSIDWMEISVLSVSESTVSARSVLHYKNGTEQSSVSSMDVGYGSGNMSLFLIGANLNQDDPIYLGYTDERINETVTRTYATGSRQLNRMSVIMDYNVTQDELSGFNMTEGFSQHNEQDVYWDRQLGVLVEMSYVMTTRSPSLNADVSMKISLMSPTFATIPEFSSATTVILVVFVSGVGFIACWKKKPSGLD